MMWTRFDACNPLCLIKFTLFVQIDTERQRYETSLIIDGLHDIQLTKNLWKMIAMTTKEGNNSFFVWCFFDVFLLFYIFFKENQQDFWLWYMIFYTGVLCMWLTLVIKERLKVLNYWFWERSVNVHVLMIFRSLYFFFFFWVNVCKEFPIISRQHKFTYISDLFWESDQ